MDFFACSMLSCSYVGCTLSNGITKRHHGYVWRKSTLQKHIPFGACKFDPQPAGLAVTNLEEREKPEIKEEERPRFKWTEIGPEMTEDQKLAISQLPPKMTKRCKALLRQIFCFSPRKTSLFDLLAAWVRIMKPRRADWLVVLKHLRSLDHPLLLEVAEVALLEESFEANVRDYTKLIDSYGRQNRLQDAENTLLAMKRRGVTCDQVILTTLVHMYSKAGNLKLAEETFEEMKLLGQPLDRRSYGSIIMAYIRAGLPDRGESMLREMEAQEIYAGREVYKALLRAYSMIGDAKGAQRVFDAIQFAGISPNAKLCALLINAYRVAGQSQEAHIAFKNMRRAGLRPNDKCIALMLAVYEKENKLNMALDFLVGLERDGILVSKEASEILARWFRRLGLVEEVDLVLREYAAKGTEWEAPAF
ncbi:pentatricopeptide repeat-containing protein At1g01970 [Malania oleifera]|uniref:pentatricopeptide repeat-containing protein At1g01970 n=1 Tax=Malania oleifera TaxID=397392 RepID=UPI0025ADC0B9|nr:pentatricopeptide repeat-containing protein At1g01970 [Malania oleifera]